MNDLMNQMLDQFEAGLMDRALKVMHVVTDEKRALSYGVKQIAML